MDSSQVERLTLEAEQLSPEVYQLLATGRKVEAIKLIREETGLSLREARELADALTGHSEPAPLPQMTEEGGASGMVAIVIAIIIAILVYLFLLSD